jgi:tetratricopeptide (TPR) repeat protein
MFAWTASYRLIIVLFIALSFVAQTQISVFAATIDNSNTSSKFLPPIAPQLDTSYINKSTLEAPGISPFSYSDNQSNNYSNDTSNIATNSSSNNNSSNSNSSNNGVNNLVRDALQKYASGQTNQAESLLLKALKTDPNNIDVNFNLGAIAEQRGDLNKAFNYYQKALSINPNDMEIKEAFMAIDQKLKNEHTAIIQERQAAHFKQLANAASSAYKSGNYDFAINNLEQIEAQSQSDPSVYYALGQAWRAKGNNDKARYYLVRATQLAPENQLYKSSLHTIDSALSKGNAIAGNMPQNAPPIPFTPSDQFNSNSNSNSPYVDNSPVGEITPFTQNNSSSSIAERFGFGGGGNGSSRIKRAAIGGLTGAAIGALTGRGTAGGVKSNALRGALYGSLIGLFTGF